jgi:hypothetical protein
MYLARQEKISFEAIGAIWGISLEQTRQRISRFERHLKATRTRLHRRAHLVRPIELDPPSERGRWHEFALDRHGRITPEEDPNAQDP